MNVKPKFVYYDIRRKQSVCLIMYTHENDVDTQVLEVSMLDNGEPIELDADYTYSAAIVNRETMVQHRHQLVGIIYRRTRQIN